MFFLSVAMFPTMNITPAQCRAARAWLQWSQIDLAERSAVSVPTINRFERGATSMSDLGRQSIVRVFTAAGITFRAADGFSGLVAKDDVREIVA